VLQADLVFSDLQVNIVDFGFLHHFEDRIIGIVPIVISKIQ